MNNWKHVEQLEARLDALDNKVALLQEKMWRIKQWCNDPKMTAEAVRDEIRNIVDER